MAAMGLLASGRVNAYILLGDPSYLAASVSAYYPFVDRIYVSYDRTNKSWTGTPLPVEQCLRLIEGLDKQGKCVLLPGDFARTAETPFENEALQRSVAMNAASADADWVLQLDTDEVMLAPRVFFEKLDRADAAGASGLDFPARWLYSRVKKGRYLAGVSRFWRPEASYPGPLAVRVGARFVHARQIEGELYRVDFSAESTDPWRPRDARVDDVISPNEGVAHFSWVRHPETIQRKFGWSGHTEQMRAPKVYRRWVWRTRHPYLTTLLAPSLRTVSGRYGICRIPEPPGGEPPRLVFGADSQTAS